VRFRWVVLTPALFSGMLLARASGLALGGAPRVFAYTALGASGGDPTSPAALAGLA
jgi:hypothetical protein